MKLAIICGFGLTKIDGLQGATQENVTTPYGTPSASLQRGLHGTLEIIFLPRHGEGHVLPPHRINYRANIAGLKQARGYPRDRHRRCGWHYPQNTPRPWSYPIRSSTTPMAANILSTMRMMVSSTTWTSPIPTATLFVTFSRHRPICRYRRHRWRLLRLHPGTASGNRRRNRPHGTGRLRHGKHDRHARGRSSARGLRGICLLGGGGQLGRWQGVSGDVDGRALTPLAGRNGKSRTGVAGGFAERRLV